MGQYSSVDDLNPTIAVSSPYFAPSPTSPLAGGRLERLVDCRGPLGRGCDEPAMRHYGEQKPTGPIAVEEQRSAASCRCKRTAEETDACFIVREAVERAAKVARSAAQAYQAMELAAAATTGVGMFVAFAGFLNSTSSLNGTQQSEGEQTLLAIQQLFDYLRLQFVVACHSSKIAFRSARQLYLLRRRRCSPRENHALFRKRKTWNCRRVNKWSRLRAERILRVPPGQYSQLSRTEILVLLRTIAGELAYLPERSTELRNALNQRNIHASVAPPAPLH
jgi:hypothetical protein